MFETCNSPEYHLDSLKNVLLAPELFFEEAPARVNYRDPVIFLLACHLAGGIVSAISGAGAGVLIEYPVFGMMSICLVAFIVDYIVGELFGVACDYGRNFRIVAYGGSSVVIFSSIPLLGFIAALYGMYLTGVGIMKVNGTTLGQAIVTVLLTFFCMNIIRFILPWLVSISSFGLFA